MFVVFDDSCLWDFKQHLDDVAMMLLERLELRTSSKLPCGDRIGFLRQARAQLEPPDGMGQYDRHAMVAAILAELGEPFSPIDADELRHFAVLHAGDLCFIRPIRPGVEDVIPGILACGHRVAVITSGQRNRTVRDLNNHSILHGVEVHESGDYHRTLTSLRRGASVEQPHWFIGDDPAALAAAKQAGFNSVWMRHDGRGGDNVERDHMIEAFSQLPAVLEL